MIYFKREAEAPCARRSLRFLPFPICPVSTVPAIDVVPVHPVPVATFVSVVPFHFIVLFSQVSPRKLEACIRREFEGKPNKLNGLAVLLEPRNSIACCDVADLNVDPTRQKPSG